MTALRLLRGDAPLALSDSEGTAAWLQREGRVLKQDPYSLVALVELGGELHYAKYYRPKNMIQRLQFRFGGCRGVAAFDNAVALAALGIEVPAPHACALMPDGVLLLTEAIIDGQDLKHLWVEGLKPARLQQLMAHAGAVLATLHEAGYSHGDAKWSNFLVSQSSIYLVDLEAVCPAGPSSGHCVRDVARFTLNAEDMGLAPEYYAAFLEAYAEDRCVPARDIEVRMQPLLDKLRARHLRKYGERGHRLV